MAYIESELAKRRGQAAADALQDPTSASAAVFDPQEELYKIAEEFKVKRVDADARAAAVRPSKAARPAPAEGDEGADVGASMGMLTTIPEVDLGME